LKLEITASTVMADPSAAVEMLQQIKSLGIHLAIDDFVRVIFIELPTPFSFDTLED